MTYPYRQPQPTTTMDDFLSWMDSWADDEKYELHDGVPVAMAGGTLDNGIIAGNIYSALRAGLKGGSCLPLRDVLLRSSVNDGFGVFPDVYVYCGNRQGQQTSTIDATAVFEVLSRSTLAVDRGYKLAQYMEMPGLRHIVLIYPLEIRIEAWSRTEDGRWTDTIVRKRLDEQLELGAFGLTLPVSEIYEGAEVARAS